MSKVTAYSALSSPASNDVLPIVDVSDTSMASSGTTKKIAVSDLTGSAVQIGGDLGGTTTAAQVTGTHLASPLPVAQGGSGTATGAAQGSVFAGPASGGAGAPAFRALTAGDITAAYPWQFLPETYGAKGDGKIIADATISGGALSTLTSATAAFTSADNGKRIVVSRAGGAATAPIAATITFVNATTITLSTPASGAVTNAGAIYGTDDTAAIQSAINAAVTYAQSNTGACEVAFGAKIYCVAGSPAKNATTQNNAQIYLPIITAANPKVTLKLTGAGAAPVAHWLETGPPASGTVLACMRTDGAFDATYGWPYVLSGPFNGYGGINGTFSNMLVVVDGLGILTPYYTSFGGLQLYGVGQADIRSYSCLAMAQVPATSVWPQYTSGGQSSPPFFTWGYVTPATGNNAVNNIGLLMVAGQSGGVQFADHLAANKIIVLYSIFAVNPASPGGQKNHLAVIGSLCSEANTKVIYGNPASIGGPSPVDINVEAEITAGVLIVDDSTNSIYGTVRFEDPSDPVGTNSGASLVAGRTNGAANVKLIYLFNNPGHVPSANAPAVPASTVAQQNTFWRDAAVTITGGTVSAIAVDGTATGLAATGHTVIVPSGKTITLTYSSAPTWVWNLL